MKEVTKNEFMQVIEKTRTLLKENSEWQERYAGYAEEILDSIATIKDVRSSFREWSPLRVYLNITSAKKARNSVSFELRYLGQTVAKLMAKRDKKHKLSTKDSKNKLEETNLRDFDCNICLAASSWDGKDAAEFRRFFKNRNSPRGADANKGNEEHRIESLLLTEFSKTKNKALRYIKPVTIGRVRFPMPTPISASRHRHLKYSGIYGGGIDILARTGTGGKATHLCIMELKDENTSNELPRDAMEQAIAYATFIRELLRSDAGAAWCKLFGVGGEVPKQLNLYAICVMPSNENNDYSFGRMELNIERDTITLHYLYFIDESDSVKIEPGGTTLDIT